VGEDIILAVVAFLTERQGQMQAALVLRCLRGDPEMDEVSQLPSSGQWLSLV